MNWQHLTLIIWLRWRLSYNQWRRAGALNAVLTMTLAIGAMIAAVMAFFLALIVGSLTLSKATPDHMMLMWDLIVLAFLFLWSMGVVTELQRSELLSLEKMLHFPISPTGAFLLNYLSSLISLSIILFLPAMMGLSIASVLTHGPAMLLLFPLVFGFLLVVSALTYQFRGWMATLMQDKRRRRTIIAVVTVLFILMTQLPNLAHLAFRQQRRNNRQAGSAAQTALAEKMKAGEINAVEYQRRSDKLREAQQAKKAREWDERLGFLTENLAVVNAVVPVGWVPYGVRAAARGNPWPGLLGSLGLLLLGGASLWRSHRTTMRFYTGQVRPTPARQNVAAVSSPRIKAAPFLERTIPGCSERVSTVALAALSQMVRAPETKMAMLSPIIIFLMFGCAIYFGPGREMPVEANPFLAISAVALTMFGLMQLLVNVFGNDRAGFRAFVLMPIARRDILLGKNLALAPFAVLLATLGVVAVQLFMPLKLTHFLATLIQLIPAYLLVCLIGNMTSMFAPMAVSSGSLKPAQPKFMPMFLHMLAMMTMPTVLLPAVAALLIELALEKLAGGRWFPLFLLVSAVELPISLVLYRFLLTWQGDLLQRRETKILEIVTSNLE